jgi:GNAT superfamily N-acetyltransferase
LVVAMPVIDIRVECSVYDSFRVRQVAGMFDVPTAERATEQFHIDLPDELFIGGINRRFVDSSSGPNADADHCLSQVNENDSANYLSTPTGPNKNWRIGVIVGPSGSGKTTLAKRLFGDNVCRRENWAADKAVVDGFGERPIKQITGMFTTVGFSSPPSWIKPYHVLSNGEQFRCNLAKSLLDAGESGGETDIEFRIECSNEDSKKSDSELSRESEKANSRDWKEKLAVFDEYTSVVDRNVARAISAAIAKGMREGRIGCRFAAVTCHYDVIEWLQPDWVIDMSDSTFQWRLLRRPAIELEIVRCRREAWRLFSRHHYLSGELSAYAKCYMALWDGAPTAFCAVIALMGRKNRRRISRIVTLPDYQGMGIGMALVETVAEMNREEGLRMNITASHPAVIAHCRRSPKWMAVSVKKTGSRNADGFVKNYRGSIGRAVVSFEYVGDRTGK